MFILLHKMNTSDAQENKKIMHVVFGEQNCNMCVKVQLWFCGFLGKNHLQILVSYLTSCSSLNFDTHHFGKWKNKILT